MACSFGATFAASLMSKLIDSSLLGYHGLLCMFFFFGLDYIPYFVWITCNANALITYCLTADYIPLFKRITYTALPCKIQGALHYEACPEQY